METSRLNHFFAVGVIARLKVAVVLLAICSEFSVAQNATQDKAGMKTLGADGQGICSAAFISALKSDIDIREHTALQTAMWSTACTKKSSSWSVGIPIPVKNASLKLDANSQSLAEACTSSSSFQNFEYSRWASQSFLPADVIPLLQGCFDGLSVSANETAPGVTELLVSYRGTDGDGKPTAGIVSSMTADAGISCDPMLNEGDELWPKGTVIKCTHNSDGKDGYVGGTVSIDLKNRSYSHPYLGGTQEMPLNWTFNWTNYKKGIYKCALAEGNDPNLQVGPEYSCVNEGTCPDPDSIRGLCLTRYGYKMRVGQTTNPNVFRVEWHIDNTKTTKDLAVCDGVSTEPNVPDAAANYTDCSPNCGRRNIWSVDRIRGHCSILKRP